MRKYTVLIVIFMFNMFGFYTTTGAEVKDAKINDGRLLKARPLAENPALTLKITSAKQEFFIGEPIVLEVRVDNVSEKEQNIDFTNIEVEIVRSKNEKTFTEPHSVPLNNTQKLSLEKNCFAGMQIPVDTLFKIQEKGSYSICAYYSLGKFPEWEDWIYSNSLEVAVKEP